MELWIRSQDKKILLKVETIEVVNNWFHLNNKYSIGFYKTNERALEVLDEIQEVLCPKVLIMKPKSQITISDNVNLVLPDNCSYERIGNTYIYEMPEE